MNSSVNLSCSTFLVILPQIYKFILNCLVITIIFLQITIAFLMLMMLTIIFFVALITTSTTFILNKLINSWLSSGGYGGGSGRYLPLQWILWPKTCIFRYFFVHKNSPHIFLHFLTTNFIIVNIYLFSC